jgi:hypothetical protein
MDAAMVSSVLTSVRESAQVLLSGSPESLALAFWGCGLLAVGAGVRSLIAANPRLSAARGHHAPRGVGYGSDERSLTESRA